MLSLPHFPAPCCLWGAAGSQSLHAVPSLLGRGSPPGPAPVSPPCATSPPSLPTGVWHGHLDCQRVGLARLLLYNSQGGGGAGTGRHVPRLLLCSWPGACAQRRNGSTHGEGGCWYMQCAGVFTVKTVIFSIICTFAADNNQPLCLPGQQ